MGGDDGYYSTVSDDDFRLREFKRAQEIEEARLAALHAALVETCDPEFFRLSHILGLDKTLELMMALPGIRITIPKPDQIPIMLNMASAALMVLSKKLTERDAAYHYQVNRDRLREVIAKLEHYYLTRKKMLQGAHDRVQARAMRRNFQRMAKGKMPYF